jgi:hypothetical protein
MLESMRTAWLCPLAALVYVACGSSSSSNGASSPGTDGGMTVDGGGIPLDGSLLDAPAIPPSLACALPFGAADVSTPTTVVGQTTHVCDEASLAAAVAMGGIITFACGGPTTITLTAPLAPPKGKDTTIDGGGTVTLDGGGTNRILSFNGGGYRTTTTLLTLQNLTFSHGHATGTAIPTAPSPCSQGFNTDAGGGAVYIVDAELHVFGSTFTNNAGMTPGPDVGGGAIYVDGSLGTTIVASRFEGNTASNGGAVGSLNSDLAIYTSTMTSNSATGTGGNNTSPMCTSMSTEIGDGGSGGAVYMDGGHEGDATFCGDVFSGNHANALGGVMFRVFDDAMHNVTLDVSTADSNVCDGPVGRDGNGPGAGAFYFSNTNVIFRNSTISNNSAPGCGGVQADSSTLDWTNVTLAGNAATDGVGGGVCIFSNGGTLTNCTLANNTAAGGTSYSNYYAAAVFGGALTLTNTILANNTTMNSEGRMQCGATDTGTNDLQWPMDHTIGGNPDSLCATGITFADPMLGSLKDNGGPTLTLAPAAASSVVQVGSGCPTLDQTGKMRATPCTIGAVEE